MGDNKGHEKFKSQVSKGVEKNVIAFVYETSSIVVNSILGNKNSSSDLAGSIRNNSKGQPKLLLPEKYTQRNHIGKIVIACFTKTSIYVKRLVVAANLKIIIN